jgi:hypothetical protein
VFAAFNPFVSLNARYNQTHSRFAEHTRVLPLAVRIEPRLYFSELLKSVTAVTRNAW